MQFLMHSARAAALLAVVALTTGASAQTLVPNSVETGYSVRSVELGVPFGGSIAPDPANPGQFYVSTGFFGSQSVLRVDIDAETTETVAGPFGNVGGISVLEDGSLAITENFSSGTIVRAVDLNIDGDFFDAGEITELIAPILVDFSFSGAQTVVAPPGNAAAIPAGALLVQTADGTTASEVLVVDMPTTAPEFRPSGGAYYSGFQFNGGLAFTSNGSLLVGIGQFDFMFFTASGRLVACVDGDADGTIDAGESNLLLDESALANGLADIACTAEDIVLTVANGGNVGRAGLPVDVLSGPATPLADLLQTNGTYLSSARLDDPAKTFAPFASAPRARLVVGGYVPPFDQATNLLVVEPEPVSSVAVWHLYD